MSGNRRDVSPFVSPSPVKRRARRVAHSFVGIGSNATTATDRFRGCRPPSMAFQLAAPGAAFPRWLRTLGYVVAPVLIIGVSRSSSTLLH
jgi:hypothetical protein